MGQYDCCESCAVNISDWSHLTASPVFPVVMQYPILIMHVQSKAFLPEQESLQLQGAAQVQRHVMMELMNSFKIQRLRLT